ncbi:zinc finger protein ZFP2-like [Cydia strobilella]|uniref:zinc finger protein ZFP2-like n=1 Tax=Cydia strobilella TaxID=1100964 RepID=UPI003006EA7B
MSKLKGPNNLFIVLDKTQNTCSEQYLLCCRACLSTDGRLYNIHDYKLVNAFSAITGAPVFKDKLPQYLCSHCCTLLMKCVSFRKMCIQTQQRLMPELLRGQLNTNYIRSINQPSLQFINLTTTEVETIEYIPKDTDITAAPENDIKTMETLTQGINLDTSLAVNIKHEPNIDIVDINNILNNTDEMKQFDIEIDEESNHNVKDENRLKRTKFKIEIDSENGDVMNVNRIKSDMDGGIGNENEDIGGVSVKNEPNLGIGDHIENINDISSIKNVKNSVKKRKGNSNTQNANNSVKKRKRNKKEEKTECNLNEKNTGPKPIRTRKRIKNEKEEMRKNKIFESDHSVQIVILSKEEQLAELAARREGRNYLESQFKCEVCYKGYGMKPAYENHVERHNSSIGPYACEICQVRFASSKRRNQHQSLHQMKMFCKLCDFVSRSKSQAMLHHGLHEGRTYVCQHCGKSFKKSTSYLSHMRTQHLAMNVACDECGEVFVGEHGLRLHKGKTHAKRIKCETCSAMFLSLAALDRHTDTAGEHRDLWPCEQCGENCASEKALHKHVGDTHPTVSIRCDKCSISFPTTEAYTTHVSRSHLQQKKKIDTRQRRCLKPKPSEKSEAICEQCGFKVPFASMLIQHNQLKHQAPKPYVCNVCSKGFTSKENLIIHIRSHTGEKPYKCKHCSRAFTMKSNLERHYKTVHLGVRGCFSCHICGSTATTKYSLRVHIDSKHGGRGWPRSRKRQQAQKIKEK